VGGARGRTRGFAIVNERAPRVCGIDWRDVVGAHLGPDVELSRIRVRDAGAAYNAARAAADSGADFVVAIGGDGTVNACANAVAGSHTRLAIIPAGTANDLARVLGLSGNSESDLNTIADWRHRVIDAVSINGRKFYSAGGVGFAAEVADTANRWRGGSGVRRWLLARLGTFIYTLACLFVILFRRKLGGHYRLQFTDAEDGRTRRATFEGYGVLVANCDRLGKSFQLVPTSEIDDGAIELIVFPKMSRWRLLKAVFRAQKGRLFEIPGIRWVRVTRAHVSTAEEQQFFGDGEILFRGREFSVGLSTAPVHFMAPVTEAAVPDLADQLLLPARGGFGEATVTRG